jgi:CheY-like chemotaxis protein
MSEILAHATGSDKDKETAESKTAESKPAESRKGPRPAIGVRVLLVSADIQTIDILCESMGKMSMHVDICSDFASATNKLCHSKFEALVVDFKDRTEALNLLKKLREMTSHKASVVLAILNCNEEMPSAFRAGASFVMVKPLSPAVLMRTLRVSYPLMVNEKRRSFRCPVRVPVYVAISSRAEFMATSANISEVGIALTNSPGLQVGDRVSLRLMLPHTQADAKITAEVCWCSPAGSAGLEFVQVPASIKEQLVSWLAARLDDYLREEAAALRG